MLFLASQPAPAVDSSIVNTGIKAADNMLQMGAVGGIALLLTFACVALMWLVWRARAEHLKDKDAMRELLLEQVKEQQAITKTIGDTCDSLKQTVEETSREITVLRRRVDAHALSCPTLDKSKYLSTLGG
jgi:hypothetical protein